LYLSGLATSLGIAGVTCTPKQKYFCALTNKTAEIEVKNRCKGTEKSKEEYLLFVTFCYFSK